MKSLPAVGFFVAFGRKNYEKWDRSCSTDRTLVSSRGLEVAGTSPPAHAAVPWEVSLPV